MLLAVVATFMMTWMFLGVLAYLIGDAPTYKDAMRHPAVIVLLLTFGWIPSIFVSMDLDKIIKE